SGVLKAQEFCEPSLLFEDMAPCGDDPGYAGSQEGRTAPAAAAPNLIEPSPPLISTLPVLASPSALIWTLVPSSPTITRDFLSGSNFMVTTLPELLSRMVMVPACSLVETTSASGL